MSFPESTSRRLGLGLSLAVLALAVAGSAAAQSMVVRSTGPSATKYPTGTKLQANDRVTLVAGDRIVLMQSGKTRTLSGPGSFGASTNIEASQSMGTTVSRMLAKGPTMRARGGATRGDLDAPAAVERAPNLWLLDYREGGTFCVADPATLMFWRPDMNSDQLLKVEHGARTETVAFVRGANYRKWPTETMPLEFGVDYQLSGAGLEAPVKVRFSPLDTLPETAEASAETLMAKGCGAQLDRLVDAMGEAEKSGS